MTEEQAQKLAAVLDHTHKWPSPYAFKFIVPLDQADLLESKIPEAKQVIKRASNGGKFLAFTFHCVVESGQEVVDIYARLRGIPGLISL